ncbi:hypothetical protein CSKR_105613 [Clonorchis sinensis]|uniref:Uncharacterized protein n=1 Tax=Clonorchis sinensis TaxID=79923 RepID=A0A419PNN7_CLOSI|nr:hypothetical protein CSKR_105613 [Clonorchis sinensis]
MGVGGKMRRQTTRASKSTVSSRRSIRSGYPVISTPDILDVTFSKKTRRKEPQLGNVSLSAHDSVGSSQSFIENNHHLKGDSAKFPCGRYSCEVRRLIKDSTAIMSCASEEAEKRLFNFGSNNNARTQHSPECIPEKNICNCHSTVRSRSRKDHSKLYKKNRTHNVLKDKKMTCRAVSKRPATQLSPEHHKLKAKVFIVDTTRNNTDPKPSTSKSSQETMGGAVGKDDFRPPVSDSRRSEVNFPGLFPSQQLNHSRLPRWMKSVLHGVSNMSRYLIRSPVASSIYSSVTDIPDASRLGSQTHFVIDDTSQNTAESISGGSLHRPSDVAQRVNSPGSPTTPNRLNSELLKPIPPSVLSFHASPPEALSCVTTSHSSATISPTQEVARSKGSIQSFRSAPFNWIGSGQSASRAHDQTSSNLSVPQEAHLQYETIDYV